MGGLGIYRKGVWEYRNYSECFLIASVIGNKMAPKQNKIFKKEKVRKRTDSPWGSLHLVSECMQL